MTFWLLLLILIILVSLTLILNRGLVGQTGGRTELPIVLPKSEQSVYYPQYMELHNVDNVLNRPVGVRNLDVQKVVPVLETDQTDPANQSQELVDPPKYYLDFKDIYRYPVDRDTKAIVEGIQPYFLNKADIIDVYGQYYYRDWRYPLQPIRLEFALDPQKFVREHPVEYPSYVIRSRDLRDLKPMKTVV